MPNFYYTKEITVGKNGEKMGFLMVDSCLMLCANYSYAGSSGGHMLLHAEHKRLRDVVCNGPRGYSEGERYVLVDQRDIDRVGQRYQYAVESNCAAPPNLGKVVPGLFEYRPQLPSDALRP